MNNCNPDDAVVMHPVLREAIRWTTSASLMYSAIMVFRCPCDVLPACKFSRFLLVAGVPVAGLIAWNVHALMRSDAMFTALKKQFRVPPAPSA